MAKGVGSYWSPEGEAEYRRVYEEARALWPPHEMRRVPTTYGTVQTLTVGSGSATPVVLLHGLSCTSLMWRANVAALSANRPVVAIDTLTDCGGGVQTAPVPDLAAVVDGMVQTLEGLGVGRAHFVGLSYGAWIAAALALHRPHLVASTTLLEPAGTIHPIRLAAVAGFAVSLVRPSPRRWKYLFARRPSDDLIALLDASRRFRPAAPLPATFSDDELAGLHGPVQVVLGEKSTTCNAGRTRERLARVLPQARLAVVPGAGHIVSVDAAPAVDGLVNSFLDSADRGTSAP